MRHLSRYKRYLAGAIVCTLLTNAVASAIPWCLRHILDGVDAAGQPWKIWIWAIVGLSCVMFFVRTLSRFWFFIPARMMEFGLRNDLFQKILSLHPDIFHRFSIGDLLSRSNQDLQAIRLLVGFVCLSVIHVSSALVINLSLMAWLYPRLTALIVTVLLLTFGAILFATKKLSFLNRSYFRESGALTDLITQILYAAPLLKNYAAIDDSLAVLNRQQFRVRDLQLSIIRLRAWILPTLRLAGGLSLGAILLSVAFQKDHSGFSVGSITAYLSYVALLIAPLSQSTWIISLGQNASAGLERLEEVSLQPSTVLESVTPCGGFRSDGLRIQNAHSKILKDISLEWRPGQTFGIFGATGSGKSTLLRLVSGLGAENPSCCFEGSKQLTPLELMQRSVYVSQSPFLFSESILWNVTLGRDSVSEEDVMRALEHASFSLDPQRFPEGLQTKVGQKGVLLSGGQRQRVALARALVTRNALLLLDDILSAVDHDTEFQIIRNLYAHYRHSGFWIASHRVSALRTADRIFCLENGAITAQGTHEELLRSYPPYRQVWDIQFQDVRA